MLISVIPRSLESIDGNDDDGDNDGAQYAFTRNSKIKLMLGLQAGEMRNWYC